MYELRDEHVVSELHATLFYCSIPQLDALIGTSNLPLGDPTTFITVPKNGPPLYCSM